MYLQFVFTNSNASDVPSSTLNGQQRHLTSGSAAHQLIRLAN